jgi:hypothetical protein
MTFEEMFEKYWEFAQKAFDTKANEAIKGLMREAEELDLEYNYTDRVIHENRLEEIVDCQFYLLYVLRKSGYTYGDFIAAMDNKLKVLNDRKWKKDETGCFSHIKEYNPPPFTEGHNPFVQGGVYTPGDPGL